MNILHKQTGKRGMFYVENENEIGAEMVYSLSGDNIMIIEHTDVSDELRGLSVGYELVHAGVEYARQHGLKILPLCPFAKAIIDKKPEFQDVLAS
jgi:hypothetical protein